MPYDQARERLGRDRAAGLWRLTERTLDRMEGLAGDALRRVGSLRLAVDGAERSDLNAEYEALRSDGFAAEWIDEPGGRLAGRYPGALLHPRDGSLQPARWIRRLAAATADAGAEIRELERITALDTTIRADTDPDVMIRIDVSPGADEEPFAGASLVETYLVSQPGYRRLAFESASLAGYNAWRWDFAVREEGVLLRKSDIFFTTADGDSFAVLIQAPVSSWSRWSSVLDRAR